MVDHIAGEAALTHQILHIFFQQFLNQDAVAIERIKNVKDGVFVDAETGALVFSLYSIYKLLFDEHKLSFSEFKQTLYQGRFNSSLKAMGGQVSVYQSEGKIDDSLYQLNRVVNK